MKNALMFPLFIVAAMACNPSQLCVEKIDPACSCIMLYDPVCGCNNKTYGNACMAQCSGIKSFTKGECKQDASTAKLEGRIWQLTTFAVNPTPQQVPEDVAITIKFEGGNIEGNGGCNNVGGAYVLDGKTLTISRLVSTKMFCEKSSKWESMFLMHLEKSKSYSIKDEMLEINCGDMGKLIFRLKR